MTGEEDVEKSVIEHVINVRERLSEMRDIVGENLTDKQSKMKAWYDRNTRKSHFSPGDEVLVPLPTESSKMTATWKGPFRSQEIIRCELSSKCKSTPRLSYLSYQLAEEI
jgi:hypothetical protein